VPRTKIRQDDIRSHICMYVELSWRNENSHRAFIMTLDLALSFHDDIRSRIELS
jgi:hypothetical protein